MQRFSKPFRGVKAGEIYPTQFEVGDECPPELVAGAQRLGVLDASTDAGEGSDGEKAQLQAQLEKAGIKYDKRWGADKLRSALLGGQAN